MVTEQLSTFCLHSSCVHSLSDICATVVRERKTPRMPGLTTALIKATPWPGDHQFNAAIRTTPKDTARCMGPTLSASSPTAHCAVCFRAACRLKSHKQYAKSTRLSGASTTASYMHSPISLSTASSEGSPDGHGELHPRFVEIGATKVDPFVEFPLPKGAKVEVHQLFQDFFTLHQTKSTTGLKAGPSPLTPLMREILSACSNNGGLCHSIVAASAVWHASYRGQLEPDTRMLSLHSQAIRTFRKGLSNPENAYSNANILAAASLTHQQIFCRSRSGLKTHINGIQALVNERGGLHNVGWLAYIILWIDYYTCLYVNQEPRFTWPIDNTIQLSIDPERIYGSAFESLQLETLLDPDLRQLCLEVCRTVELLEYTAGTAKSKSVQDYYRYKRTTMCIQLGYLHARFHNRGTADESVSLALNIIVLQVFFMHVLDESRMDLCSKLRISLELTSRKFLQHGQMDLLSWILFVAGALAPEKSPWKGWFIRQLKAALAAHFSSATDESFLDMYIRGYIGKVLRNHAWSQKLLAHGFETTLGFLTPNARTTPPSERKTASANDLFPG